MVLTDDATVRDLNYRYRGFDKPTDVLSFAQRDSVPEAPPPPVVPGADYPLGDVVISVDTAKKQAAEHNVTLSEELALLTVHGILHLLGYLDDTDAQAETMRERERAILGL